MISFIIPTYKNTHSLQKCVSSIANACANGQIEYEILVVYNCPTTQFVLPLIKQENKKIRVLKNEKLGAHYSRKMGLDAANGSMVVFVDDDNYLQPSYIEFVQKNILLQTGFCFIGCASQEQKKINWQQLQLPASSFACGSLANENFYQNIPVYWGAGMAMDKKLALAIFKDELLVEGRMAKKKYIMSGEDHEISLRAYAAGATFIYYKEIGLYHDFDISRLTQAYHSRLMTGFIFAAWTLKWYYMAFKKSWVLRHFAFAFGFNFCKAALYFCRHPFSLASRLIVADALDFSKKKKQFLLLKSNTKNR